MSLRNLINCWGMWKRISDEKRHLRIWLTRFCPGLGAARRDVFLLSSSAFVEQVEPAAANRNFVNVIQPVDPLADPLDSTLIPSLESHVVVIVVVVSLRAMNSRLNSLAPRRARASERTSDRTSETMSLRRCSRCAHLLTRSENVYFPMPWSGSR